MTLNKPEVLGFEQIVNKKNHFDKAVLDNCCDAGSLLCRKGRVFF